MTVTDRSVITGDSGRVPTHPILAVLILTAVTALPNQSLGQAGKAGETSSAELGVQVADGFEVSLFAGDELAHDIFSMTVDAFGRVVVSGPGYVKILIDEDNDGRADSATTYVDGPATGAQGMYFAGRDLICAGDAGLIRYRDRNGDDRADGPPDVFLKVRAGNEHDLHAIRKGPDGWWYLIAGNAAGVNEHYAAMKSSPVTAPHAGTILRLSPNMSQGEIFAHGFRNAYDFDFAHSGDLFSFDSDGEPELSLPWYVPTRVLHVLPGSHQGWVKQSWKRPDEYFDMPPAVASFGRGSPTGVETYRHFAFPKPYQNAVFVLDWTFGQVYALPLERDGSTWKTKPVQFLSAIGQHGFAPTDIAIGPRGEMYVCTGGRGTKGAVYRIQPKGQPLPAPFGKDQPVSQAAQLELCLNAPCPLTSWSRRVWEPLATRLTGQPFIQAALDQTRSPSERIRAIEILTDRFNGLDSDLARSLARDPDPLVRARVAWSIGRSQPGRPNPRVMAPFVEDSDPLVVRCALESLIGAEIDSIDPLADPIGRQLAQDDRFVRQTAMRMMTRIPTTTIHRIAQVGYPLSWNSAIPVAAAYAQRQKGYNAYAAEIALKVLEGSHSIELKREAIRVLQLALSDLCPVDGRVPPVFDGYTTQFDLSSRDQELDSLRIALNGIYPLGDPQADRELERVIAMVQPPNPKILGKVLDRITDQSDPVDDIHRLIVAARIPAQPTPEQRDVIAHAILHLEPKLKQRNAKQDSNWADRILELYEGLVQQDPRLPIAILEHPDFGLPGHVPLISAMPPDRFDAAITAFSKKIQQDPEYAWTPDVVFLLGQSYEPADRQRIRERFRDFALRNAVVMSLSMEPTEEDRRYFTEVLDTAPLELMEACVGALGLLSPSTDPAENVRLALALRKLSGNGQERVVRDQLVELLRRNLGQDHGYVLGQEGVSQQESVTAWTTAVQQRFPDVFASLQGANAGESLEALRERLAAIPWQAGHADRGEKLFHSRSCSQCHGQSQAIGPDLSGVTNRFSREDLFTAIVLPSRDVSPRYQTEQVVTRDGMIRTGMILYEAVDGLVLRDANNQTYRIEVDDIEFRRTQSQSLMPEGLLRELNDQDWADLYAYLRQQGATATAGSPRANSVD